MPSPTRVFSWLPREVHVAANASVKVPSGRLALIFWVRFGGSAGRDETSLCASSRDFCTFLPASAACDLELRCVTLPAVLYSEYAGARVHDPHASVHRLGCLALCAPSSLSPLVPLSSHWYIVSTQRWKHAPRKRNLRTNC